MPELPEVETIARKLGGSISGKRITGVTLSGKALRRPIAGDFALRLQNRIVWAIHRRGKYLVVELRPKSFWLIHLGMSGRLRYTRLPADRLSHTHAVIQFDDGSELQYCDPRRFGLLDVYEVAGLESLPELQRLGMDPLHPKFDARKLWPELSRSRRELKSFLLDQSRIAGVGNIYACEALFRARLHPARRCSSLTRREAAALARATRQVLQAAIDHRGTSFSDFRDSDGEPGEHQDFLRVFQREGEPCRRCRATIRRLRQANRSTYFCPRCQSART